MRLGWRWHDTCEPLSLAGTQFFLMALLLQALRRQAVLLRCVAALRLLFAAARIRDVGAQRGVGAGQVTETAAATKNFGSPCDEWPASYQKKS